MNELNSPVNPSKSLACLQKYMSAFSASKYALYGLTEALRAEVAGDNIHVGQVCEACVQCVTSADLLMKQTCCPPWHSVALSDKGMTQAWQKSRNVCASPQVYPGVVKSNHLERTTFFGKDVSEERRNFRYVHLLEKIRAQSSLHCYP